MNISQAATKFAAIDSTKPSVVQHNEQVAKTMLRKQRISPVQMNVMIGLFGTMAIVLPTSATSPKADTGAPQGMETCIAHLSLLNVSPKQRRVAVATPIELLELIKKLHDNFALLDGKLVGTDTLRQHFPEARIEQVWPFGTGDSKIWKNIDFATDSPLAGKLHVSVRTQGWLWGGISFVPTPANEHFSPELLEKILVPDATGSDPFGQGTVPATNETLLAMNKRPQPSSPKGYFEYTSIKNVEHCRSQLFVRLNENGLLMDIELHQEVE